MKILKPGKVEMRKFACEKCRCEFVADKAETKYSLGYYVSCPLCDHTSKLWWDNGEPYEEPMQDADAIERLADLIYDGCTTDGETAWEIAKHLTENGVTFREGMRL